MEIESIILSKVKQTQETKVLCFFLDINVDFFIKFFSIYIPIPAPLFSSSSLPPIQDHYPLL